MGRYALGVEIARGGMGAVYLAEDSTLDRQVAVKVLLEELDPSSGAARRFANEARITARLQHPAIPPVHDLGILPDGRPFLAMKLIEGRTLHELLSDRADPSTEAGLFVAVFEQLCQAIAYAHSRGVIHRDLKPAYVMVGRFGEVQVMDWGLAKEIRAVDAGGAGEDAADDAPDLTRAGTVLGTPGYMAPEQARGEAVDARADVFALGSVLAAILTGQPAFVGTTAVETIGKAAAADLADVLARLAGCGADAELVALARRSLAAASADRPADARAVAAEVASYRAGVESRFAAGGDGPGASRGAGGRAAEAAAVVKSTLSRVLRGGSFVDQPSNVRSSFCSFNAPTNRIINYGFRPARTFTPKTPT